MGERILAFMSANYVTDLTDFAEGVVGVPLSVLESWIYDAVDGERLPVKPILICAEALGTNVEYLTGMSDDPRPPVRLTYDESVLLQAFRDTASSRARERLLQDAVDLAAASAPKPHPAAPFAGVPVRRKPPANEG